MEDDARRRRLIAELTEHSCERLSHHPDDVVWQAATKLTNLSVGVSYNENDVAVEYALLTDVYTDAALLAFALTARTPQLRIASLPLLAIVAPSQARDLIMAYIDGDMGTFYAMSYEAAVLRGIGVAYQHAADELPMPWQLRRVLDGKLHIGFIDVGELCAFPIDEILTALIDGGIQGFDRDSAAALCEHHPDLATGAGMAGALERVVAHQFNARFYVFTELVERLADAGHTEAAPLLFRVVDERGRINPIVARALVILDSKPELAALAERLDAEQERRRRTWDPHHTDLDWEWMIQASYALEPSSATSRLGRYFEDVTGEHRAKLAHDILLIGTDTPEWLTADGKWPALLRPLCEHELLMPSVDYALTFFPSPPAEPIRRRGGKKSIPL